MTIVDDRYIAADTLSEAWLEAVYTLDRTKGKKAVHLIVRIARPTAEIETIRAAAEWLIGARNVGRAEDKELPAIETTRNTIFPAAWARRPSRLQRPQRLLPRPLHARGSTRLRRKPARHYFGRIVSYPRAGRR